MSTAAPTTETSHLVHSAGFDINPTAMIHAIAKNWGWILTAGIISVVGGSLALLAPALATGVVGMFIATMLLLVGCMNLSGVFFAKSGLKLDSFLVGTVQVLMAAVMAFYPFASLTSLTLLIVAVLMVDGIARIALAWQGRNTSGWGWTLAGGLASLAMCAIIISALPLASFWVIGTLVGVSMIMNGAARIALAMEARKIAHPAAQ